MDQQASGEESTVSSDAGLAADVARAEREILAEPAGDGLRGVYCRQPWPCACEAVPCGEGG
jgi:hypothetical protein